LLTAPLAALYFAKDASLAPFFIFYALIIPAGFVYETSSALLQISGHFRSQAALNLAQSIITAAMIVYAFFSQAGLGMVLTAYLAGKVILGFGYASLALWRAYQLFGPGWWRVSFQHLPPAREFWTFAFSSNFSGSVNLLVRDSDILWINSLAGLEQGGYYKLAMAIIGYMLIPVDPFIKTSFPEITRAVAEKAWGRLKNLLRRLTLLSGAITASFGLALLILGGPFIFTYIYEPKFLPALIPALILFIGYGVANTFFWNRPLILALGKPTYPLLVTASLGLGKIALSFYLVPRYGMNAQAALMSAYFVFSIGIIVWRGLREINVQSREILHSTEDTL
jgi:O-antigen/teichoic acid export membrane protein